MSTPMTLLDRLSLLSLLDAVSVGLLLCAWLLVGWWTERPHAARPSVTILMAQYRRDWMHEMITRDPRIFDATILGSLRQGTSFFASTCVIAIGGVLALIGNAERLMGVAQDLTLSEVPTVIWELKLGLVALLLSNAFLKFAWSNRLFGYCAVVMAAVPNRVDHPMVKARAAQAAELNIRAAGNFNRGLRSMYFAMAALAWLLGPLALFGATSVTVWVVWSREFLSRSRDVLLDRTDETPSTKGKS